ncbi:MAG: RNA 2',3'-cyclic phosphodiesterase [Candidatus Lokiarchaeota archaeon]|nr:RNA 2',3'-cyclic phosphodiesterase [Candidatus Lokiarchaeota archaeon]
MIRAFIAIELNDNTTIDKIKSFSARLKQNQDNLKIVAPENLHLTVKFLGNISESLAPKIYKILKEEINENMFKGKVIEYKLKGVGQFNKFSILWVKLIGDIQFLQEIKNSTEELLDKRLDIQRDRRTQFKPHLTIGRLKKDKINYQTFSALKNLINENKNLEFGPFVVDQVKLKKSDLTPKGPIYSDLVY